MLPTYVSKWPIWCCPLQALEALALAAYQTGTLTAYELRLALGIETRHELDGFLKARGVNDGMTAEEWRREQETLDRLGL